jgi:hypothetical protein
MNHTEKTQGSSNAPERKHHSSPDSEPASKERSTSRDRTGDAQSNDEPGSAPESGDKEP